MESINKWIFFGMNYPSDFIERCWENEPNLARHLRAKFDYYYKTYGCRAVMNTFYCELSGENRLRLMAWVIENYNDEQKITNY